MQLNNHPRPVLEGGLEIEEFTGQPYSLTGLTPRAP